MTLPRGFHIGDRFRHAKTVATDGHVRRKDEHSADAPPKSRKPIPLVPLVVLFGAGMLLIMWGGVLVSWWVALAVLVAIAPALLWMRFVTAKDDQRFRQMFVALKLRLHDHNHRFWQARSYAPTLYRGARDAWYR